MLMDMQHGVALKCSQIKSNFMTASCLPVLRLDAFFSTSLEELDQLEESEIPQMKKGGSSLLATKPSSKDITQLIH